jgi:hypothetical protein
MFSIVCGGNKLMCGSCVPVSALISAGADEKSMDVLVCCGAAVAFFFAVAGFLLGWLVFLAEDVGFFLAVVGFFLVVVSFFVVAVFFFAMLISSLLGIFS